MAMTLLHRRALLAGGAALALLPGTARAEANLPPLGTPALHRLRYDLSWAGIPVGRHVIDIVPGDADGDFLVTNRVEIVVDLLLFDAMRFEHDSTEIWRGGHLAAFESATVDNGDVFAVTAAPADGGLKIEGLEHDGSGPASDSAKKTTTVAPVDIMTNNDIWVAPVPGHRPLLNAKNGEVVELAVETPRDDRVRLDGERIEALRYDIASPVAVGELYYRNGLFVAGSFTRKGRTVDYELIES